MKKLIIFYLLILLLCPLFVPSFSNAYADLYEQDGVYYIYDNNGNQISHSSYVEVGDIIITNDFKQYEIYSIDKNKKVVYAKYTGSYIKPKVREKSSNGLNLAPNISKSVGLYLTHNDESYVPTDGVSSVYGEGGVHDVANALASSFNDLNYTVYLDETLHLPHDSGAYTRSGVTAQSLLNKNVDALFDIHRDGVSRSVYVKTVDGVERCKIRIVVGQANPNKDVNLQFAMYLVTVAQEYCPWLFLDIYYAKGHYNQALTSKGLLFEMGTYLAEKELVLKSVPYLAEVVDKTLFKSVVTDDNDIEITDQPTVDDEENLVNNVLENNNVNSTFVSKNSTNVIVFAIIFIVGMVALSLFTLKRNKKSKKKNK